MDEVRGGIAAGDCRKALWLRIAGGSGGCGGLVDADDGWAAMTGWSLREGRLKCSMWPVEGRGRLELQASFLPKVQCPGLAVRWGPVSGVDAGDDMRFRRQHAILGSSVCFELPGLANHTVSILLNTRQTLPDGCATAECLAGKSPSSPTATGPSLRQAGLLFRVLTQLPRTRDSAVRAPWRGRIECGVQLTARSCQIANATHLHGKES